MAVTANIHEAKTTLSKLIERALAGEEVVIAKAGKPVVRLEPVALDPKAANRAALFGKYEGQIVMTDDWEDPVFDEELLSRLYGRIDEDQGQPLAAEPPTAFDAE